MREDVFHTGAKLHNIILEGLENQIHRLAILLLKTAALLTHNIARHSTELLAHHTLNILLMSLSLTGSTALGLQLGLGLDAGHLLGLTLRSSGIARHNSGITSLLHSVQHIGRGTELRIQITGTSALQRIES